MTKVIGIGGFTAAALAVMAVTAAPVVPAFAQEEALFTQAEKKFLKKLIKKSTPKAFAGVNSNGTLTTGYATRGIVSITNPATGYYCFQLNFTPKTAAANAQAQADEDGILSIDLVSPFTNCPVDAEAMVHNYDASDAADQNDSFIVQFD